MKNNIVLTIEQTRHLMELDEHFENAMAFYEEREAPFDRGTQYVLQFGYCDLMGAGCIPTYTLQDMLEELPEVLLPKNESTEGRFTLMYRLRFNPKTATVWYEKDGKSLIRFGDEWNSTNMLDSVYEMYCWYLENKNRNEFV